jgi:hypothetical protein
MKGWCPRCDAVREAEGACPECKAPLVALDERPPPPPVKPASVEEAVATEVGAVVEPPPRSRLRVALAVAALVLMGLAFVAGRSTGGRAAGAARGAASATTQTTEPQALELQRRLGWRSKPVNGVLIEAVSISRIPSDAANADADSADNAGSLVLRADGLAGRRLLGLTGLRLVDTGGGVFASPDPRQIGGLDAVPVDQVVPGGSYTVDLGPTPSLETLDHIQFEGVLLSASTAGRGQVQLPTGGAWPARPPLRAVEPSAGSVDVPLTEGNGAHATLPLRVSGAFVGAGRAVVVLSLDEQRGPTQDLGRFPLSATLRAGGRTVCSRQTSRELGVQASPLLVVDCPTPPAPGLTLDLAAGVEALPFRAELAA